MLLVLPFSERIQPFARHIASLGGVAQHDLLVVSGSEEAREAEELLNFLKISFFSAELFVSGAKKPTANVLFQQAAQLIDAEFDSRDPWIWCDETCSPLNSSWLSEIQLEYVRKKALLLCDLEPSVEVNPATGRPAAEPPRPTIYSAYPSNLYSRSILIRQLVNKPWNVTMRFELRRMATQSETIQHMPQARNFKKTDWRFIYDAPKDAELKPIGEKVVLITGVTDGSIFEAFKPKPKRKSDE